MERLAELQKDNNETWKLTRREPEERVQVSGVQANLGREAHLEAQTEVVADKFDDGQGSYKKADPDEDVIKLKIMKGDLDVELEPTFGNAVDTYINDYNLNKATNENQK